MTLRCSTAATAATSRAAAPPIGGLHGWGDPDNSARLRSIARSSRRSRPGGSSTPIVLQRGERRCLPPTDADRRRSGRRRFTLSDAYAPTFTRLRTVRWSRDRPGRRRRGPSRFAPRTTAVGSRLVAARRRRAAPSRKQPADPTASYVPRAVHRRRAVPLDHETDVALDTTAVERASSDPGRRDRRGRQPNAVWNRVRRRAQTRGAERRARESLRPPRGMVRTGEPGTAPPRRSRYGRTRASSADSWTRPAPDQRRRARTSPLPPPARSPRRCDRPGRHGCVRPVPVPARAGSPHAGSRSATAHSTSTPPRRRAPP